ncbi:MAG: chemotaxis protein CheW [Deltaproteobacteria bacterium]|nr:MAG: chemotaxis protein CheW [Deltaproteobacteria bacterium]
MKKRKTKKTIGEDPLDGIIPASLSASKPELGSAGTDREEGSEGKKAASGEESSALPQYGLAEDILGTGPGEEESSASKGTPKPAGGNGESADEVLMKLVTFYLGKEEYALPISQVQEINRVVDITRVPNSPEHVMGVINLRGKIVPVIELKHRLKLGGTQVDKDSRIVVVEHGPRILGMMVDRVSQVLNISSSQIEDAPEEVVKLPEDFIRGVGKIEDRMIILLNLEQIVGKEAVL